MTAFRANLPYKSFRFSGEETLSFLQGQLTQDIKLITSSTCHYGAYCDVKGRMLANFLLQRDDKGFILRLHEALADKVIKRLQMFILRAKVTIEPLSNQSIGLNQSAANQLCEKVGITPPEVFGCVYTDDFSLSTFPHNYFILTLPEDSNKTQILLTDIDENIDQIESLRLSGGHFHILLETNEKILPQQTPLESWGAINYKKGCYVGQEVIARNKYRGKVKKGMAYATIDTPLDLSLPSTVIQDGKAIGQIIDYHSSSEQTFCLAIIGIDSFEQAATIAEQTTKFSVIN